MTLVSRRLRTATRLRNVATQVSRGVSSKSRRRSRGISSSRSSAPSKTTVLVNKSFVGRQHALLSETFGRAVGTDDRPRFLHQQLGSRLIDAIDGREVQRSQRTHDDGDRRNQRPAKANDTGKPQDRVQQLYRRCRSGGLRM